MRGGPLDQLKSLKPSMSMEKLRHAKSLENMGYVDLLPKSRSKPRNMRNIQSLSSMGRSRTSTSSMKNATWGPASMKSSTSLNKEKLFKGLLDDDPAATMSRSSPMMPTFAESSSLKASEPQQLRRKNSPPFAQLNFNSKGDATVKFVRAPLR